MSDGCGAGGGAGGGGGRCDGGGDCGGGGSRRGSSVLQYLVQVDDSLTDAAVDRPEEVGRGQGDLALRQAVAGGHHQPGEGGVRVLPRAVRHQVFLRPAVVEQSLPVRVGGADHHEELGAGLVPAGQRQAGAGAAQAGSEGVWPTLVSD